MLLRVPRRHVSRKGEQGYMLMALLLTMALLAIAATTVITSVTFNLRRDREEEMIHRGAQYARAIRAYYKKFGRYPASIENLENTNQMRFLRKRYKDPITKKDFRLLHFGEVKMMMSGFGGGGGITGASTLNSNGTLTNASNAGNNAKQNGTDSSDSSSTGTDSQDNSSNTGNSSTDQGSSGGSGQTFGGMPIVGVASTSKEATVREFDKKKKYSDWQFVYDPALDRGILISTPYQPQQLFGIPPQNVNGPQQNQTPGLGTGAPGVSAPPTNPVSPTGTTLGNPNQPTDTPNQQ